MILSLAPGLPSSAGADSVDRRTFAETLRARFEVGELYGFRGDDDHSGEERLEAAIEVYFGLAVTQGGTPFYAGDAFSARAIIELSPAADLIGRDELVEYNHPALAARECIVWDVLALARQVSALVPADER